MMDYTIYLKVFLWLSLILLVIVCCLWGVKYLKSLYPDITNREIKLQEVSLIDNKNKMVLVQCGSSKYLLLVGNSGNLLIDKFDDT